MSQLKKIKYYAAALNNKLRSKEISYGAIYFLLARIGKQIKVYCT